jgi:hypothetical protein
MTSRNANIANRAAPPTKAHFMANGWLWKAATNIIFALLLRFLHRRLLWTNEVEKMGLTQLILIPKIEIPACAIFRKFSRVEITFCIRLYESSKSVTTP